jgi:raffinose/stachyose/melibiose transport system permease protein
MGHMSCAPNWIDDWRAMSVKTTNIRRQSGGAKPGSRNAVTRNGRARGAKNRRSWFAPDVVGARKSTIVLAVVPAVAATAVFVFLPALQGIRASLSTWQGFGPMNFVGLRNYTSALHNPLFWQSMRTTVVFTALSTVGIVGMGLVLAAAVSARTPGYRFYRVVWFIPGVAPVAAGAVFWASAFQPNQGAVNAVLGAVGLGAAHSWLANESQAIYPAIFVAIWTSVGFAFLLLLGSMEQVPISLYEAAKVDGASTLRIFFKITLPMIRPVLVIVTLLEIIWNFNSFTLMYAMTKGGPGYSTTTLPLLVYRESFQNLNYGPGSAMALLGSLFLLVIGAVSVWLNRSNQKV